MSGDVKKLKVWLYLGCLRLEKIGAWMRLLVVSAAEQNPTYSRPFVCLRRLSVSLSTENMKMDTIIWDRVVICKRADLFYEIGCCYLAFYVMVALYSVYINRSPHSALPRTRTLISSYYHLSIAIQHPLLSHQTCSLVLFLFSLQYALHKIVLKSSIAYFDVVSYARTLLGPIFSVLRQFLCQLVAIWYDCGRVPRVYSSCRHKRFNHVTYAPKIKTMKMRLEKPILLGRWIALWLTICVQLAAKEFCSKYGKVLTNTNIIIFR